MDKARTSQVRALLTTAGLPATAAETVAFETMVQTVRAAVDQLYRVEGARYAEPLTTFVVPRAEP
jgi:hypothetical protein